MHTTRTIYLVKTFGPETGYTNIKTFTREDEAKNLVIQMMADWPIELIQSGEESIEVEAIELVEEV